MVKNPPANSGDVRDVKITMEKDMATYSSIPCLENFLDIRNVVDYSSWGHKELDMTEHAHTHTYRQVKSQYNMY